MSLLCVCVRRLHSAPALPHNLQELSASQTREVASSQAARVFGSGFLSHQGGLSQPVVDQSNTSASIPGRERERLEFFQQIKVNMDVKTNVPEPYVPPPETGTDVKEGIPVGLSDSQVNLEAKSNMDFRLEILSHN